MGVGLGFPVCDAGDLATGIVSSDVVRNVDSVSVFHINIQGMRSKFSELEACLVDSAIKYDFVCITEHWLEGSEVWNGLPLSVWTVSSYFVRSNHIRGGALILANSDLSCFCVDSINDLSIEMHCEVCSAFCKNKCLTVVCIY